MNEVLMAIKNLTALNALNLGCVSRDYAHIMAIE